MPLSIALKEERDIVDNSLSSSYYHTITQAREYHGVLDGCSLWHCSVEHAKFGFEIAHSSFI
jgi:hypothetical protein